MQQTLFEEKKYPPKSIFKSACQKHIRRGNVDAALRCAKANIDQDAHDFARRVMVLAPEEVSIHPLMVEMPEIITRLGKKGEKATKNDIDTMLTIVRDLALTQKRDLFEYKDLPKFTLTKEIFDYLQPWQQDIIKACKFRGDIGGMQGDVKMFKTIIDYLANKWANGERYDYEMFYDNLNDPKVDSDKVGRPIREDIPFYAVDFHCFPPISRLCLYKPKWENGIKTQTPTRYKLIIDKLKPKTEKPVRSVRYTDTDDDEWVKKIMWLYESSLNYKVDIYTGEMLNIFAYEGITPHDKKIFDYCHKELVPIWSDVVEWYISKYDF